jgi:hypothetical protein
MHARAMGNEMMKSTPTPADHADSFIVAHANGTVRIIHFPLRAPAGTKWDIRVIVPYVSDFTGDSEIPASEIAGWDEQEREHRRWCLYLDMLTAMNISFTDLGNVNRDDVRIDVDPAFFNASTGKPADAGITPEWRVHLQKVVDDNAVPDYTSTLKAFLQNWK